MNTVLCREKAKFEQKEQNKNAAPRMGQQKLTICGAAWYDGRTPKGVGKRRCYRNGG